MAVSNASRFLAPYYLSALALTLGVYPFVRAWFLEHGPTSYSRLTSGADLWHRERMALMLLGVGLAQKFWRRTSLDAFLADAGVYFKMAAALLCWFIDSRLAGLYALAAMVSYLLFPQPLFKGPTAALQLTPDSFQTLVIEEGAAPGAPAWLVEFGAAWSPPCIALEPVVAELSLEYTCSGLRWGQVDASRWPGLAEAHKVSAYGSIPMLPTFVLFEKGKEVGRIPVLFQDGHVSQFQVRRRDLITAFDLDQILDKAQQDAASVAGAASGKGAASAKGGKAAGGSAKKRR